ncbi:MAG TPA: BtpA/SgcQ family protein [Firmicutes bacterium]|nr:BtpA/SgcQ family protein [Bacillota bacterium]
MLKELIGVEKPVIAMAHFPPLPGSPLHDVSGGITKIYDSIARDVESLISGGVDAILFGNEGDRPYQIKVDPVVPATMAAVIARVTQDLPVAFGVDVLWDPIAAIALAKATGAKFVREVFTNVYASDMGLWDTACGTVARYRKQIGADNVRLFFNINAEFAVPIAERPLAVVARSVVFSSLADAVCVSGPITGEPMNINDLAIVKKAVPDVPVIANTGVNISNVSEVLKVADAAIVGTSLKYDGITWNPVDPERVRRFMDEVRGIRERLKS